MLSGMQPFTICSQKMGGNADENMRISDKKRFIPCSAAEWERGVVMIREVSIYALKPRDLLTVADPVGPDNDAHLVQIARQSACLIAAWQADLITWEAFLAQYRLEQQQQFAFTARSASDRHTEKLTQVGRSIDYLRQLEECYGVITVCCWEQDERCHRFALVQLVEELPVPEHRLVRWGGNE